MKEELLNKIRDEVESVKNENRKINDKYTRLKELENNPLVREYLFLLSEYNKGKIKYINEQDNKIIDNIYIKYLKQIDEDSSNKIYVYMGTYVKSNSSDRRVSRYSKDADYSIYRNLELIDDIVIPIEECDYFEKENLVIYPQTNFRELEYGDIQRNFFYESVVNGQDSAKKKILKKYNVDK